MKSALWFALASLSVPWTGSELATRYSTEHALRVESESALKMETTRSEMLRDGEPVEGRGMGGGGQSETRKSVVIDRVKAVDGARPTEVRRTFETVEGEVEMRFGPEPRTDSLQSPFQGLTVDLTAQEDGEVEAKVVDGSAPEGDALDKQRLELALDALLPGREVDADTSWDLGPEQIARALSFDVAGAMFPRPQVGAPDGGQGGGGGRGGRGRGFRGFGAERMLAAAEWSGKATLLSEPAEALGESCFVIALVIEAESDLGDGESTTGSFEAKLEGKLYFSNEKHRPVLLEIEGTLKSETNSEREREGSVLEMHRESEGSYTHRVTVTEAPAED